MTYTLGVDLGSGVSTAAVARDGLLYACPLDGSSLTIPSIVRTRDDGDTVIGEMAEVDGGIAPARMARATETQPADATTAAVATSPEVDLAMAKLLEAIVGRVATDLGARPDRLGLVEPASHNLRPGGPYGRLAATTAGAVVVTAPVAAVAVLDREWGLAPGTVVGVLDLGGDVSEAALVRKAESGFELVGRPRRGPGAGGAVVDAALFDRLDAALGNAVSNLHPHGSHDRPADRLRADCRRAKDLLLIGDEAIVEVPLRRLRVRFRVTRADLQRLVRPMVEAAAARLDDTLAEAGVAAGDLDAVLLIGGPARLPAAVEVVTERVGRPVVVASAPEVTAALGAALLATPAAAGPVPTPPGPTPPGPTSAPATGTPSATTAISAPVVGAHPDPGPPSRREGSPDAGLAPASFSLAFPAATAATARAAEQAPAMPATRGPAARRAASRRAGRVPAANQRVPPGAEPVVVAAITAPVRRRPAPPDLSPPPADDDGRRRRRAMGAGLTLLATAAVGGSLLALRLTGDAHRDTTEAIDPSGYQPDTRPQDEPGSRATTASTSPAPNGPSSPAGASTPTTSAATGDAGHRSDTDRSDRTHEGWPGAGRAGTAAHPADDAAGDAKHGDEDGRAGSNTDPARTSTGTTPMRTTAGRIAVSAGSAGTDSSDGTTSLSPGTTVPPVPARPVAGRPAAADAPGPSPGPASSNSWSTCCPVDGRGVRARPEVPVR